MNVNIVLVGIDLLLVLLSSSSIVIVTILDSDQYINL